MLRCQPVYICTSYLFIGDSINGSILANGGSSTTGSTNGDLPSANDDLDNRFNADLLCDHGEMVLCIYMSLI